MGLILSLDVPGEPVPKGRPRFGRGRTYTPRKTRDAEEALAWAIKAAYKPTSRVGPIFGVELVFFCRRSSDCDNLTKLVLDCLNPKRGWRVRLPTPGLIWQDDSQVRHLRVRQVLGALHPHTRIRIWTEPEIYEWSSAAPGQPLPELRAPGHPPGPSVFWP